MDGLPLSDGDNGEAVRDLQRRLVALGFDVPVTEAGHYGPGTAGAVARFQDQRGLSADGTCGVQTWAALVEAGFRLGDRLLYLRRPMLRGDDVADLQRRLGGLGFDAGRVDGIFGPATERALRDFQRNSGATTDGVCGPEVLTALSRLGDKVADGTGGAGVARVRERVRLLAAPKELLDRRIVVGESGGLGALATALSQNLHRGGARVAVLHHPDWSTQARQANDFGAEAFLALQLGADPAHVAYYATEGFESEGGRRLATLVSAALVDDGFAVAPPRGMRLPVLRETRMPAVLVHLAPPDRVVAESATVAALVAEAVSSWVHEPLEP